MRGLGRKALLGYMLLILLPMCILGPMIYQKFKNNIVEEYSRGKQQLIEQSYANFKVQLTQIETLFNVVQYNTNLIELLDGYHMAEIEQTYVYRRYIDPMFKYIHSSNDSIDNVTIYMTDTRIMSFNKELLPISAMPEQETWMQRLLFEGHWEYTQGDSNQLAGLTFNKKIFNEEFSKVLGMVVIRLDPVSMKPFVDNMGSTNVDGGFLLTDGSSIIYERYSDEKPDSGWIQEIITEASASGSSSSVRNDGGVIVNGLRVDELDLWAISYGTASEDFPELQKEMNQLFIGMVFILILLSLIYYYFTVRATNRILRLAKHMRQVDENNLITYQGDRGQDEIGFLTNSYNAMMNRINELVNEVQRAEILRKEAAYAALQAQIKPHFLYNTLESMRMMAESYKAREVADMCFVFGRLIRYSLSNASGDTTIADELKHAEYYLKIYKLRMGELKLRYQFDVQADTKWETCPRFILQPIIENSIIHGFSKQRKSGMIEVKVTGDAKKIIIHIQDDGQGIPEDKLMELQHRLTSDKRERGQDSDGGLGLFNVHERIGLYYGGDSGIWLDSKLGEGTICTLSIERKEVHE